MAHSFNGKRRESAVLLLYVCDFRISVLLALISSLLIKNDNANFKNDLHALIFNEALVGK